ncbi:ParB/RepB/Spo0J family partition protein [Actinoallomurus iriomotensis]|uniref:ParB/RepB/Spo0J family partition protein n=1 Tax=Actinoallomurus iriomotensis TaxID=478107 RepID=UPI002555510F|nr:ParB/RepB/Spo0J family partition protein [Actinoallomurus iriomotensis]
MNSVPNDSLAGENALARYLSLQQADIERSAAVRVPIESLVRSGSPRLDGEDAEHVRTLAESGATLPPIVVHMPSRRIIDGMHRLQAAILRGEKDIDARFFYGTEADVFLLSVVANIQHGLPLSQNDRMAAAERVFVIHPEWSDRMVAVVVGLSGKKIAALRRQVAAHLPQPAVRIGRDGRLRPVDGAVGRERAAKLIASDPGASLRQIARAAGISPATAADVRDRIRRGEDPIPSRRAAKSKGSLPGKDLEVCSTVPRESSAKVVSELTAVLERLRRDPSLRFTEAGRTMLRMFDACQTVVRHEEAIKKGLPPHRLALIAELNNAYAEILRAFATGLQEPPSPLAAPGRPSAG